MSAKRKKPPPAQEQTERLFMRTSKEFMTAVDDWRRVQPDIPGRSEAIRRLVEQALSAGRKK